jgi:hypothetical protein
MMLSPVFTSVLRGVEWLGCPTFSFILGCKGEPKIVPIYSEVVRKNPDIPSMLNDEPTKSTIGVV